METQDEVKEMASLQSQSSKSSLFLDAWVDSVANIRSLSCCIRSADLQSDGEYRLVIVDSALLSEKERRLRVYKGTSFQSEVALLSAPVACCVFYPDQSHPQIPSVAVASGPNVFVYRNMRPYFKFTVPPLEVVPNEMELWKLVKNGEMSMEKLCLSLQELQQTARLTQRSLFLLQLQNEGDKTAFVEQWKQQPLEHDCSVTCMEVICKSHDNERAVGMVVLGTEGSQVLILEPAATAVQRVVDLPSVPCLIAISGVYEIEHRIFVACRNAVIYVVKSGKLSGSPFEFEHDIVAMTCVDKSLLVACVDRSVQSFGFKGKRNFSIFFPAPVLDLVAMASPRIQAAECWIVSLANGEVRVYNNKYLVSSIKCSSPVTTMRFGRYGREDSTLILVHKNGSLSIKMLHRTASLEVIRNAGPPAEQDIPLNIPVKSKLFVEQTLREQTNPLDIHRVFQRDLVKLRLLTARTFVKTIAGVSGPLSAGLSSTLRLDAQVQGLGPTFKLKIALKSMAKKPLSNIPIIINHNPQLYRVARSSLLVPNLIPGSTYETDVLVENIENSSSEISIFVCNPQSSLPIISAVIRMPSCVV